MMFVVIILSLSLRRMLTKSLQKTGKTCINHLLLYAANDNHFRIDTHSFMVFPAPWMSFAFLAMMTRRKVNSIEIELLIANLFRLETDVVINT